MQQGEQAPLNKVNRLSILLAAIIVWHNVTYCTGLILFVLTEYSFHGPLHAPALAYFIHTAFYIQIDATNLLQHVVLRLTSPGTIHQQKEASKDFSAGPLLLPGTCDRTDLRNECQRMSPPHSQKSENERS